MTQRTSASLRRFIVLCLLGAAASPPVLAQASVSIFGTIDLNLTYTRAGGQTFKAMEQGGHLIPSRLGFRGTEDLGDGFSASFWIESALLPDTGDVQGPMWNRRSTLSLAHRSYGELRLGRDYTPTFWNVSRFAPFGTVGVGGSANIIEGWPFGLGGARTVTRASNSVGYFLPGALRGVYGQAMVALPEGVDGMKYTGARIGYADGPFDVALAYGQTPTSGQTSKVTTIGGSFDFGIAKLMGYWFDQRARNDQQRNVLLGVTAPIGQGVVRASIAHADRSGAGIEGDDARQFAVGYSHFLSKRTALYAAYSRIDNRGNAAYVTSDTSPAATPAGNASGLQVGVAHNF